jgi:subtilisin family serine protease
VNRRLSCSVFLFWLLSSSLVSAEKRFIARVPGGNGPLQTICAVIGCNVQRGLDESLGQVFLVSTSDLVDPDAFLATLRAQPGVSNAELDILAIALATPAYAIPPALTDAWPVDFFGQRVRRGYVEQPANAIVRISDTQNAFNVRGSGIVAVIDTGVDPNHPVLMNFLVKGYDFTRDLDETGSERGDLDQSTAALVDDQSEFDPAWVNQSTAALVDEIAAGELNSLQYAAFGHGTMVAGVIHLVAPRAMIMPMKAFQASGMGYMSDVLRAIYRSVQKNAKILNMSFGFSTYSSELQEAIDYAAARGVIPVASAGNNGSSTPVYPGALNNVICVASTDNLDQRSLFSNYGFVWVAAPGEGIVTTYPYGKYAAAWGTSFSAPFVAGAVALLLDLQPDCSPSQAAGAIAHAKWISQDLGQGRLDLFQAVQSLGQVTTPQQ